MNTERFPWIAVSALVSVVVVSAVAWLQIPDDRGGGASHAGMPTLVLGHVDERGTETLLAERLEAYDPTPLFLPSLMNSNEPPLRGDLRDGLAGPFEPLPPQLTKNGLTDFLIGSPTPLTPLDGFRLTERADAPLTLSRGENAQKPLEPRLGRMHVVDMASGQTIFTMDLPLSAEATLGDWQPLQLMGAVTRAGLTGDLVVTVSSGSDEIDEFFRSYLGTRVRVGARLPHGFYEFLVGP